MGHARARILVHLVFSTKYRERILTSDIRVELYAYMAGVLRRARCPAIRVGGVEDHVHILLGVHRQMSVAQAVELVKRHSTKWLRMRGGKLSNFHWQVGYGAFSVSRWDEQKIDRYIRNQEHHHRKMTYRHEYRELLRRNDLSPTDPSIWR